MNLRRGFALRDLLVTVIVLFALAALTVPAISQVRMDSSRQACIGNYRFIAQASGSYSNDFGGQMWALSWKRGMQYPGTPPFYFGTDVEAQAFQANVSLMRLAGLPTNPSYYTAPSGWIASVFYTHVALAEYVNLPLPASYLVCPEDWTRQRFLDGDFSHLPADSGDMASNWRIPYRSSYTAGTYQWGPSRQTLAPNWSGQMRKTAMWYSGDQANWAYDGDLSVEGVNRPRLESEVRFPANKVFLSDDYARHNGKPRFYAYQSAGQDLLFYDGAVRYFRADSTNPGWDPSNATNRGNMKRRFAFTKRPDFWGSLDNNATQAAFQAGWYRWTRGGLFGWDVPRMSTMVGKLPNANIVEKEVDTSVATGTW